MNRLLTDKTLQASSRTKDFLFGLMIAISASLYILFAYFNFYPYVLNSIFSLLALSGLLIAPKRAILSAAFFIAFFWIYWFGFSFQYYSLTYLIPFVSIGLGVIMLIFALPLAYSKNIFLRALLIFLWSLSVQFDTNWIQPEYMLVYSYFGVQKYQFLFILLALALFLQFRESKKAYIALLLLIPSLHIPKTEHQHSELKIKLYDTKVMQDYKWNPVNRKAIVRDNLKAIDNAIKENYNVVVLPESAFPMFLNYYPWIINKLQKKSTDITIITGALLVEGKKHYNVTYIFKQGKVTIAKKTLLVPFGEYVPLPEFLKDWVNKTFFDGESDFVTADKKTYFDINGTTFVNAICYEALCEEMYMDENGSNIKNMIAISNNGWFLPSSEPSFQKIMMQYFANKYGTTIYHSANRAGSGIIYPH